MLMKETYNSDETTQSIHNNKTNKFHTYLYNFRSCNFQKKAAVGQMRW